jgi:hypothetical protein
MARIHFRISAALARWRQREPAPSRRFTMMDLQGGDDLPRGPGWFDSSWDLGNGLAIDVAEPGDPAFLAWLEAQACPLRPHAASTSPQARPENALEFEAVDWQAWGGPAMPPGARPGHVAGRAGLGRVELTLALEPTEQELALLPA